MKKTIITLLLTVLAVFLAASMRANTVLEGVDLPEPVELKEPVKAKKIAEAEPKAPIEAPAKPTPVVYTVVGDWVEQCKIWAKQAGVPLPQSALNLIERESRCSPAAVNASSGACGIGQQLPCGKWPHQWDDPVGGLKDMYAYVLGRYGSWDSAWVFWQQHMWY